jgi:aminoglycoside phosphotransferase family enzyme
MSTVEKPAASLLADPWLRAIQGSVGNHIAIDIVETELSWVYLTDKHAYKIKKSVNIGSSHNRSIARRRHAYLDEFSLNQRLAPGVYIGVLPITQEADGTVKLNGKGAAIEFAIKMRRLPPHRNLVALIQENAVTSEQVLALAHALATFYEGLAPAADSLDELRGRLFRRINGAARQLQSLLPAALRKQLRAIWDGQHAYVEDARMKLNVRICDGRIVDGHGDLRPEHIYFERRPLVIDCLEYSAALRKVDVLDDLGQLTVSCEHLGRSDIGATVIAEYSLITGDSGFPHLEAFYKSLRAMESASAVARQAKAGMRSVERHSSTDVAAYLKLAQRYADVFA